MTALRQKVLAAETALALRRFNAWWEGYAFDPAAEKADIESRALQVSPPEFEIPSLIWGAGRDEPGDSSWTMRQARALGLGPKARVTVFGAGAGAPLRDLKAGARWSVCGLGRVAHAARGLELKSYDEAMAPIDRQAADGAIVFFEMHRDGDPAAFARYAADFLKPSAPVAVVDFALTRAEGRAEAQIRSGFDGRLPGAPRLAADYVRILKESGFSTGDVVDETRLYLPLIARGFTGWRRAYEAARARPEARARAQALSYLGDYAALWADRFEALKGGALQVVRIGARRL